MRLQKCKFVKKVLLMFYQPFHLLTPLLSISSLLSHSPSLPIALPRSLTPINISFFLLLSHTPQSIFLLYIFPFLSHSSISLYLHPSLTILPLYLSPFLSPYSPSIYLSIYLHISLTHLYLSIFLPIPLSTLSISLYLSLSLTHPSIYLSISFPLLSF